MKKGSVDKVWEPVSKIEFGNQYQKLLYLIGCDF